MIIIVASKYEVFSYECSSLWHYFTYSHSNSVLIQKECMNTLNCILSYNVISGAYLVVCCSKIRPSPCNIVYPQADCSLDNCMPPG